MIFILKKITSIVFRILVIFALLYLIALCAFGIFMTFEQMSFTAAWGWRALYGGIGVLSLFLIWRVIRGRRKAA